MDRVGGQAMEEKATAGEAYVPPADSSRRNTMILSSSFSARASGSTSPRPSIKDRRRFARLRLRLLGNRHSNHHGTRMSEQVRTAQGVPSFRSTKHPVRSILSNEFQSILIDWHSELVALGSDGGVRERHSIKSRIVRSSGAAEQNATHNRESNN